MCELRGSVYLNPGTWPEYEIIEEQAGQLPSLTGDVTLDCKIPKLVPDGYADAPNYVFDVPFNSYKRGEDYLLAKDCVTITSLTDYDYVDLVTEYKEVEIPTLKTVSVPFPKTVHEKCFVANSWTNINIPSKKEKIAVPTAEVEMPYPSKIRNIPYPSKKVKIPVPSKAEDIPIVTKVTDSITVKDFQEVFVPTENYHAPIPSRLLKDVYVAADSVKIQVPVSKEKVNIPLLKGYEEIQYLTLGEKTKIELLRVRKKDDYYGEEPSDCVECVDCEPECGEQAPGVWTDSGSKTFILEVTKRSAVRSPAGKDPYTPNKWDAREAGTRTRLHEDKPKGETRASKDLPDRPHHDLVIRFMDIDYVWKEKDGRDYRMPVNSTSRYHANQLRIFAQTAHIESASIEEQGDDCRWQRKPSRLAALGVAITRLGPIENIDAIDRPAALPSDMSERTKKRRKTDAEQSGEYAYAPERKPVSKPDVWDGDGKRFGQV